MDRIFIGVAWPYSNNAQHFGHVAGVYLPADIFARYHRMKGNDVLMVSGSDMHGTPTAVTADKEGVAPEVIAERFHRINSDSLKRFGISYDLFTHTSTPKHIEVVHDIFLTLLKKGYIYHGKMNSSYCANCQKFLPDRYVEGTCPHCRGKEARGDQCSSCGKLLDPEDLIEPACKLCGNPSEIRESEHFFLKLTSFKEQLSQFIDDKKFWKDSVLHFTKNILAHGLKDRAVTRDIEYGVTIPVNGFEKKRIYVWFEAVSGYLSASKAWAEMRGEPNAWEKYWLDPKCRHYYFLGKDNIMFHTIIWPSILLGYGNFNLPYNVPANDHLTLGGEKISKSKTKDTSILLSDYLDVYQPDPMRYYLSIHMPELHDTAFTWEEFFEKNNSELVGAYGNFIHRVLTFTFTNFGQIPEFRHEKSTDADRQALDQIEKTVKTIGNYIEECQFKNALESLMQLAHFGNRYFNNQAPWTLLKTDKERCEAVLNVSLRLVSAMAVLSAPFMPHSADQLWKMLGNDDSIHGQMWESAGNYLKVGVRLPKPLVLFTKLGEDKLPGKVCEEVHVEKQGGGKR